MKNAESKSEVFTFVPSYNHAPFIEKCLKSIINQTLKPKKLLVIDDGSKDDSPKIIEKVLKNCPFDSELIVRENRGLCATLNQGFSESSGEYFAYIGSDDIWLSRFLEER
ncbi:MAG TPA: glycosyltransferase family A protein, partial [Pyrinomonadaceae bacterium]|nr:glycosyltransferase family A protein [Pyrinomonadaceae bacterium]